MKSIELANSHTSYLLINARRDERLNNDQNSYYNEFWVASVDPYLGESGCKLVRYSERPPYIVMKLDTPPKIQ